MTKVTLSGICSDMFSYLHLYNLISLKHTMQTGLILERTGGRFPYIKHMSRGMVKIYKMHDKYIDI